MLTTEQVNQVFMYAHGGDTESVDPRVEEVGAQFEEWLDKAVETAYAEGYAARGEDDEWYLTGEDIREWEDEDD